LKIDSTMFGEIEFDPANIIKFPNGLVGFDEQKEYKLLHSEEYEGLRWLQSVTDADLAFSLMEPGDLGYELEITLSDSETELLACSDANDLIVFLLVYEDKNQASDLVYSERQAFQTYLSRAPPGNA